MKSSQGQKGHPPEVHHEGDGRQHPSRYRKNLLEVREKHIWPPSSPDSNSVDFFVCRVCEVHVNKASHNNFWSLMAKMKEGMGYLGRDMVAKACRRFRSRLEAVVEAGGDFIE